MKAILRNNIFTNPQGWAEKWVGSSCRYRLAQSATVVFGVLLVLLVVMICKLSERALLHPRHYVGLSLLVFITVIELPLCYLRALRYYVGNLASSAKK